MTVTEIRRTLREATFAGRQAVIAFLSLFNGSDYAYRVVGAKYVTFCVVGEALDGQITVEQGRASKLTIQHRRAVKS